MSELNKAVLAVMKELPSVFKNKSVSAGGGRSYNALSYDALVAEMHDLMVQNGIRMSVSAVGDTKLEVVRGKHKDGYDTTAYLCAGHWDVAFSVGSDREVVRSYGYALDSGDKADGKACTYATKSAILKFFFIESSEDEEARPTEPGTSIQDRPRAASSGQPTPPTEKQIAMIQSLGERKGVRVRTMPFPDTSKAASAWIDKLMAMPDKQ